MLCPTLRRNDEAVDAARRSPTVGRSQNNPSSVPRRTDEAEENLRRLLRRYHRRLVCVGRSLDEAGFVPRQVDEALVCFVGRFVEGTGVVGNG